MRVKRWETRSLGLLTSSSVVIGPEQSVRLSECVRHTCAVSARRSVISGDRRRGAVTACGLSTEGPVFFLESGREGEARGRRLWGGWATVDGLLPPLPVCDLQWSEIECRRQLGSKLSELPGLGSASLTHQLFGSESPRGNSTRYLPAVPS